MTSVLTDSSPFRPSQSLFGAALTVCVLTMLLLLGTAAGLFTVSVTDGTVSLGEVGVAVLLGGAVAVLLAFFAGGYFTTWNGPKPRRAVRDAFAMWAATTFFLICVAGSAFWSQLTKVQMSLGAAANAEALLDAMTQMNVQLVSDITILKGKAVTTLSMEKPNERIVRKTAKEIGKLGVMAGDTVEQKPSKRLAKITDEARGKAASASLLLFAALLLSAGAAFFGARVGARS